MAKRLPVRRPYERLSTNVRNQSSRNGVKPRLIVLHSTESHNRPGVGDLASITSWFDNPAAQASSHVLVDNEGISAKCVDDQAKAWTQSMFNSVSLSVEMIGFASDSQAQWLMNDRAQLKKTAKYVAYWSKKYDIPIRKAKISGGTVTQSGVIRHMDLGQAGGGHHDPGNFPFTALLVVAQYYKRAGWPH